MLGMRVFYKIKKVGIKKICNEIQKDKKNVIFVIYIPIFSFTNWNFFAESRIARSKGY